MSAEAEFPRALQRIVPPSRSCSTTGRRRELADAAPVADVLVATA